MGFNLMQILRERDPDDIEPKVLKIGGGVNLMQTVTFGFSKKNKWNPKFGSMGCTKPSCPRGYDQISFCLKLRGCFETHTSPMGGAYHDGCPPPQSLGMIALFYCAVESYM